MAPEESDTGQGEPALPCRLPYSMTLLGKASQIPAAFRRQKPAALPCMKPWKKSAGDADETERERLQLH